MKYLSNIEPLQMNATPRSVAGASAGWTLNGRLPWITNLRREGFLAAAAFDHSDGAPPSIFAIPYDAAGVVRSARSRSDRSAFEQHRCSHGPGLLNSPSAGTTS
jgi:alkylation response protein AidB-like acyl-CoA dehydrogenase